MQRHRITIAFGIALAVHAGAIWWWPDKPVVENNESGVKIDLVLAQVPSRVLVQPDQAVEETQDSEVLPEPIVQAPSEAEVIAEPIAASEGPSFREGPSFQEGTLPRLDLTRPDDWTEVAPMPGTAEDFARAFRGEFYDRLEQRQTSRARSQLLAGRRVAQRGLPADQYNTLEQPGSGHFKTAAGCFDLKPDIVGTVAGGQRTWMTACKDLIRSPFELPPVEFDALGRAAVP